MKLIEWALPTRLNFKGWTISKHGYDVRLYDPEIIAQDRYAGKETVSTQWLAEHPDFRPILTSLGDCLL